MRGPLREASRDLGEGTQGRGPRETKGREVQMRLGLAGQDVHGDRAAQTRG